MECEVHLQYYRGNETARIEKLYTQINIDGSTEILESEMIETANQ